MQQVGSVTSIFILVSEGLCTVACKQITGLSGAFITRIKMNTGQGRYECSLQPAAKAAQKRCIGQLLLLYYHCRIRHALLRHIYLSSVVWTEIIELPAGKELG